MSDERPALSLRIEGRVQGVWYRGWAVREAKRLCLNGWIRNAQDGSVEAVICGSQAAVRQMVDRCRQGPPAAKVTNVIETIFVGNVPEGFHQMPTER